jgi:hypothetical protein
MHLLLALISVSAWAYIPEYGTIASHAAEQHGRGAYHIEQEVTYRKGADAYTVKESWDVQGEGGQRLTIEGRGPLKGLVGGTIVYENSAKFSAESGQGVRQQRLGEDWLEPLFHFRSSKWFRARLANLHVTSADALKDRPPLNSEGDPVYEAPSFIRLSRTGGSIAWAIGVPPTVGVGPTVWIEQDQFVLRKYRSANQLVLKADDYAKYDEGFWYPRSRSYQFGPYTVTVQTLLVRALPKLAASDTRFKPASLNSQKDAVRFPDVEGLREFYSRFR